jgi:alkylresorcinol/alkylpyrone synthase
MTRIVAVDVATPPHRYPQEEITDEFARTCLLGHESQALLRRLHASSQVNYRHLVLPLDQYATLGTFTNANNAFLDAAADLGAIALTRALDQARVAPDEVDFVLSSTVTGIAVPSLEARIAARIGLRADVKRVPLMGLGCMAGAAGIARLHDFLVGAPTAVGALVCVELCSLTVQHHDPSVANLVASGLFGDGAGAVVALGSERAATAQGPRVVDSRSHLYPHTERAMGWDVGESGLKVILGQEIPELVKTYLHDDVREFLADHDLKIEDVGRWISHPGGPKIIEAICCALGLNDDSLSLTWRSLNTVGNMSSVSVLDVLRMTMHERTPAPGEYGLLLAMGPGFSSELVLLRW